ncbi:MAG TPA: ADOP family duplicated permease [Thermoanaerobaculia bacterium]|nr:ADOP family duplicated permease [Thermoanaerobaculia bacterium]
MRVERGAKDGSTHRRPVAERLYRRLLVLLPARFHAEAGSEMVATFAAQLAAARRRGALALIRAFFLALLDLVLVALLERVAPARALCPHTAIAGTPSRGEHTMSRILFDLAVAARSLRRAPGFTAAAVVILALAIGANATVFSLVEDLFLTAPPHVAAPQELVRIGRTNNGGGFGSLAYPDYEFYRDQGTAFAGLLAYDPSGVAVQTARGEFRETRRAWFVSGSFFDVLGVEPALGRVLAADDDVVDRARTVAVLSHRLWQELGSDPGILGGAVSLNGQPFTVIGVAPSAFRGISPIESPPDLYVPVTTQPLLQPAGGEHPLKRVPDNVWVWLSVIGRLQPGATIDDANTDLQRMSTILEAEFAEWNDGIGAMASPSYALRPGDRNGFLETTRVLMAVVAMVLLVACANVAILLLARGTARRHEIGVRAALGARGWGLARGLLAEAVLLAAAGAVLGFALAHGGARLATAMMPYQLGVELRPGAGILAVSMIVAVAAALLAAAMPALEATRLGGASTLGERAVAPAGSRAQAVLVVAQVAVSVALVVAGALFVRSLMAARAVDLGFGVENRHLLTVKLDNHGYDAERGRQLTARALERFAALPEVASVSATRMVPFLGMWSGGFVPEGRQLVEESVVDSGFNAVGPGYFETMAIPILRGRGFDFRDGAESDPVAVVNEAFAERFWPGENAIGKRIYRDPVEPPFVVVGLARNAHYYELVEEDEPQVYFSLLQGSFPLVSFVARGRDDSDLAPQLRSALAELDPDVAVARATTLEQVIGNELARFRSAASLVGLFAALALVMAAAGLYGALSYLVVQRRREIGIRLALGAAPRRVGRSVVGRAVMLVAIGAGLGLVAAAGAVRWIESQLFGIEALDPLTFLAAPSILLLVGLLAALLPARRAMSVDPIQVMRV